MSAPLISLHQRKVMATNPQHKDSSGRRIRAFQSVLKMVLKSPKCSQVTPQDVQDAAFKGTKFEQHECIVVAKLTNTLRPYKRPLEKEFDWNKLVNAAKSGTGSATTSETTLTKATWDHPACENTAEKLDVRDLAASSRSGKGLLVFGGIDYGVRTMSETCGLSLEAMEEHINK
ncbi:hypothetical protein BGZ68_002420 [Mortierella alpina]|nr:hypothetical protein BGZ68_002420 [Mortierella alpina]